MKFAADIARVEPDSGIGVDINGHHGCQDVYNMQKVALGEGSFGRSDDLAWSEL